MSRNPIFCIVVFLILALIALSAAAADAPDRERNWQLRFGPMIVGGDGNTRISAAPGDVHIGGDLGSGGGAGISLERRINPLLGIEFGLAGAGLDLGFRVGAGDDGFGTSTDLLVFTPITVGANFHLIAEGPVDVYIGPMLAWAKYSELEVRTDVHDWPWWPWGNHGSPVAAVSWRADSELTWGAKLGAGFAFGKKGNSKYATRLMAARVALQGLAVGLLGLMVLAYAS